MTEVLVFLSAAAFPFLWVFCELRRLLRLSLARYSGIQKGFFDAIDHEFWLFKHLASSWTGMGARAPSRARPSKIRGSAVNSTVWNGSTRAKSAF
jgi:hypothetical protein